MSPVTETRPAVSAAPSASWPPPAGRCAQHGCETSGVVGRGKEQQAPRRGRQAADTLQEDALHAAGHREMADRRSAGQLVRGQDRRQLQQRQRVATRLRHEVVADLRGDRARRATRQERGGVIGCEAPHLERRQWARRSRRTSSPRAATSIATPSAPRRRATKSSASADAGSSQWASSIRHTTGWRSASCGHEREAGDRHEVAVVAPTFGEPERPEQRCHLLGRETVEPAERRTHELGQRGERQGRLGLDAPRGKHMNACAHSRAIRGAPSCRPPRRRAARARRCATRALRPTPIR